MKKNNNFENNLRFCKFFLLIVTFNIITFITIAEKIPEKLPLYIQLVANKYYTVIYIIIIYYIYIIYINTKGNYLKSVFINLLGIIVVYNTLLSLNPLGMLKLSSEYVINNIFYFYLSFLIISFNYNIYEKIIFVVDLLYMYIYISQRYLFHTSIMIVFVNTVIIFLFARFINLDFCLKIEYVLLFITLSIKIIYIVFNNESKKEYTEFNFYNKTRKNIKTCQDNIEIFSAWIRELLKIKKIKYPLLMGEKGEVKYFNTVIFFIVKIFPLYIFSILILQNCYYLIYSEKNNNYCDNIDKKSLIVKLDNGNVLENKFQEYSFKESECNKKKIEIEVSL